MIKVTTHSGHAVYLAPTAIVKIAEAGVSQAWHGIRANLTTFDGKSLEICKTAEDVAQAVERASIRQA